MRHIEKGREPRVLTQHRPKPHARYGGLSKDDVRDALVRDQGYLCAYCMQRIEPDAAHMKIEHWKAQSKHQDLQLKWRNMLGVCMGRKGQPHRLQHCDSFRENRELIINPLDHPERYLSYTNQGEIRATRPDIQADIDEKLNLNLDLLKRRRRAAWQVVQEELVHSGAPAFTPAALQRKIRTLKQKIRKENTPSSAR